MLRFEVIQRFAQVIITLVFLPFVILLCVFTRKARRELIWGPVPVINNKYWSYAMQRAGWKSQTLMKSYYASINKREDFDLYFEDLVPKWIWPAFMKNLLAPYFALSYIIRKASVVHVPFSGGPLGDTPGWRLEAHLLRHAGIRIVVIPYGADVYMYSKINDPAVRGGFLLSYPEAAKKERDINRRVTYWSLHADVIVTGFTLDGLPRWDIPVGNMICLDTEVWKCKREYSTSDGVRTFVRVMHAPNHRGLKGTEFLIQAVDELRSEGVKVELVLLEKVPNDKVRELMQEVDIMADQLVLPGYGLAAVEGMASGLPVICNLENEAYTRIFRRYSYLNECTIVSSSAETFKRNLMLLITNPELRKELGQCGRQYVEKYHSFEAAQYLFGSIYDKIVYERDIDLMNLFHPLLSEYNKKKPYVKHQLVENRLPEKYIDSATSVPFRSVQAR